MTLFPYRDYFQYKDAQVKANHDKLHCSWVRPETVALICEYILKHNPSPQFGLCHGTRQGHEQRLFSERLGCQVIGTEISDTASKFASTIQWDFHLSIYPGECDFVYSNSLDHAFNPLEALRAWLGSLKPGGVMVIEWTEKIGSRIKRANATDPFAASTDEVCGLIRDAGGRVLEVRPLAYGRSRQSSSRASVSLIFAERA